MEKSRAIKLLEHLAWDRDIERNPYGDALNIAIDALKAQLSHESTTSDLISKFIDGLEEIFADIRERHVDDSVCGLCEHDGAYMGQSGDWCNECPGFDRDDCFKLSDKARRGWAEEIIKALPTIQPEPTDEQKSCEYCHEDSDGYTRPIEKNCHAYIRFGMNGWELDLKAKGWHGEAQIKFCPMCGRKLQGGR